MELWIRSQDRESIIKIENISIDSENYIIGNLISDDNKSICDYWRLGHYETKERALEVLDEIQKLIMPTLEYNPVVKKEESWEEEYQRTVLKGYDVKIEQAITYVYEIPKE